MKKRKYLTLIATAGGLFLAFVWESVQATKLGYCVEQARRELKSAQNTNEYLRHELQSSLSPDRLQALAQQRLGMIAPDPDQIIMLGEPHEKVRPAGGWLAELIHPTAGIQREKGSSAQYLN